MLALPKFVVFFVCSLYKYLILFSSDIEKSLLYCIRSSRPFFSATATQEILDEFRPRLCPFDSAFSDAMCYLDLFIPVHLPPELHDQGFKYESF